MGWKKVTQGLTGESINTRGPNRRYDRGKRRVKGEGRVCAEEGCGAILSIYNPADHCAIHSRGDGQQ